MKITALRFFHYSFVIVKCTGILFLIYMALLKTIKGHAESPRMWGAPFPFPVEIEINTDTALEIEMEKMKKESSDMA